MLLRIREYFHRSMSWMLRTYIAPYKYFNGIDVHVCSQDLHVTFSELCFGDA